MTATKQIPEKLIYEMDSGIPIYYSGYRDYLSGKHTGEIMRSGNSILQAIIASKLVKCIGSKIRS